MKNGINIILLEYYMHHNKDGPGEVGIEYATEHENLAITTLLERIDLEADNCNIWFVLEDLMLRDQHMLLSVILIKCKMEREAI